VIYYTIAQIEMERNNLDQAITYLKKSTENNTVDPSLKNKAFLQMAEMSFTLKKYRQARNLYDSVDLNDPGLKNPREVNERKHILINLVAQLDIVQRQDSLQRIAAMPEEERKSFVKKVVHQIRKEKGLKEDAEASSAILVPIGSQKNDQEELFTNTKGEWYFYNATLKSKGASEFKAKWGNRGNVDNWRRAAGMSFQPIVTKTVPNRADTLNREDVQAPSEEISFDALYAHLPLTEKQMKLSNDSLSEALYKLGKSFANDLEDCTSSIPANERIVNRFPGFNKMEEVLFTLYYCYNKSGETVKAQQVKKQMEQKFAGSRLTTIVSTGKDPGSKLNEEATKAFQNVYDLFIEGNFTKAIADKKIADSVYGSNYWTPQLMYIEAVYYIKQKQDAKATEILNAIIAHDPGSSMAVKAGTMIDVLSRRQKIEDELNGLNVTRVEEKRIPVDTTTKIKIDTVAYTPLPQKEKPKEVVKAADQKPVVKTADTVVNKPIISAYAFKPDDKYYAAVILTKVDMVWVNETKNAFNMYNRGKYYNKQFEYTVTPINAEYKVLLIGNFDNAQAAAEYVQSVKPVSNSQIVPWLATDKYSFTIISAANLEILKTQQDIGLYKQFIEKNIPGKF
jgi:tetratricopeptide (TPR) repeat protein